MYYIPVMGLIGLAVMIGKALWVNKQDAGTPEMKVLAGHIASGASACVLHYTDNNKVCNDGDVILMDFGAELGVVRWWSIAIG